MVVMFTMLVEEQVEVIYLVQQVVDLVVEDKVMEVLHLEQLTLVVVEVVLHQQQVLVEVE